MLCNRSIYFEMEQSVLDLNVSALLVDLLETSSSLSEVDKDVLIVAKCFAVALLKQRVDEVSYCFKHMEDMSYQEIEEVTA